MLIAKYMEMISGKRTVNGQHSGKHSTEGAIIVIRNSQVNNRAKRRRAFFVLFFNLKISWWKMSFIIITNNDMVYNKYKDQYNIELYDCSIKEVMLKVRDRIHEGYKLLTHPLSSSIKPNESLFKSIMISDEKSVLDYDSLLIIENGIMTCDKFNKIKYNIVYTDRIIEDFKLIDLTVLESALNRV